MYLIVSEAKTPYALRSFFAKSPARPCKYTPKTLASKIDIPCAISPEIIPAKTSPLPAFASALLPVVL